MAPRSKKGCPLCSARRQFLGDGVKSVAAFTLLAPTVGLLGACGGGSGGSGGGSNTGTPIANNPANTYDFSFSQYLQLGNVGGSLHVNVAATSGNKDLYVTRVSNTSAIAVSTVCTHQGCQINAYDANSQEYACPCHGSVFASDGTVVQGPASQALTSYTGTIGSSDINFTIP